MMNSIGYVGVLNYTEKTTSVVLAQMTREQILKLSKANRVIFSLETMDEPLRGELEGQDLQPFREFVQTCFLKTSTPCSDPKAK